MTRMSRMQSFQVSRSVGPRQTRKSSLQQFSLILSSGSHLFVSWTSSIGVEFAPYLPGCGSASILHLSPLLNSPPTSLILLMEMASSQSLMSQWSTSFRELLLRYAYLTSSIHIILISSLIHRNTVQILLLSSSHSGTQDTHPHLLSHLPAVSSQSRPILHHASAYSVYSAILLPSCEIILAESFSRSSV